MRLCNCLLLGVGRFFNIAQIDKSERSEAVEGGISCEHWCCHLILD